MKSREINSLFKNLSKVLKNPKTDLKYKNKFTLLISVVLSAQCTDVNVNNVTKKIYKSYNRPEHFVKLGRKKIETLIKKINFFRNKAKSIYLLSKQLIEKYNGPKYVGLVSNINYDKRYEMINNAYFDTLKKSKIIVTANPPNWEGDFRLWEALLMGNLVLCDKMIIPHIMKYPLVNKKHLIYYNTLEELQSQIIYYLQHERGKPQDISFLHQYLKYSSYIHIKINIYISF